MGTRSVIAAKFEGEYADAGIVATYCHWDGYLSGVGKTLLTDYNDGERAFTAADFGYFSTLPAWEDFETEEHRNSDEPMAVGSEIDLVYRAEGVGAEWCYLWKDGKWFYADCRDLPEDGLFVGGSPFVELTLAAMLPEFERGLAYVEKALAGKLSVSDREDFEKSKEEFEALIMMAEIGVIH